MADLPHVTEILSRAGLVDSRWFTDYARDKGTAVHLATRYLDENDLEWESLEDGVALRVRQYQRFLDEKKPEILSIEEEVVNETLQYCGRLDRRLKIDGFEGILDLKGPCILPWQAIQVSLYASCFARSMKRWTLHLHDDRYQLREHTDRKDWEVAKASITLAAWRQRTNGK